MKLSSNFEKYFWPTNLYASAKPLMYASITFVFTSQTRNKKKDFRQIAFSTDYKIQSSFDLVCRTVPIL